jgi:DNA replication protein DnaC
MRFISEKDLDKLPKTLNCEIHGEYEVQTSAFGSKIAVKDNCSECAKIKDKERLDREAEAEREDAKNRLAKRIERAGVSKRNLWKTFDSFKVENEMQSKNLEVCKSFTNMALAGSVCHNIFMIGSVGTGKTHLASSVIHELIDKKSIEIIRCIDLIRTLKDTWSRESSATESQVINYYSNLDVLIIDEVGIQFGSETEKMFMFDIINGRYENMKPTIFISNLDMDNLKAVLGDQAVDRMREDGAKVLVFDWQSYRK